MLCNRKFGDLNAHSTLFLPLKGNLLSVPKNPLGHIQVEASCLSVQVYVIIKFCTFSHRCQINFYCGHLIKHVDMSLIYSLI